VLPALAAFLAVAVGAAGAAPSAVQYTIRLPDLATHVAEIEATFPTGRRATIELMMPVWSPGFYVLQDHASRVERLTARSAAGQELAVERPKGNRWRITTGGAPEVHIVYRLVCQGRSVTTNWVGTDYALFNGPATFITLADDASRPHEVTLEVPSAWESATSLDRKRGRRHQYVARDYDVLADSPIAIGPLDLHEFRVGGATHVLVNFGEVGQWNAVEAVRQLQRIVEEHRRFLGALPFKRYVFLNAFRQGAGGLEHLNSTLLTSSSQNPMPGLSWFKFASHEYFHAFNVKRLRPIELGPFDYENPPRTPSLWLSEGVTTYYGDLAVVRAGVSTREEHLAGVSAAIRSLQNAPGRLKQTVEESSLGVWNNSNSGIGVNTATGVSYYGKGHIIGFLLDAHVRRVTRGARSFDDVFRLAYRRYGGARGFRPEELVATASEVAGVDLKGWLHRALATTEELDYSEALDWFGLQFNSTEGADPKTSWKLEVRPDASSAQRRRLDQYLSSSGGR
jgi:predicted metalloprotease with PDZ domain